ncbi:MAG: hypothetical protein JO006_06055 [Paucibacter sp.]|nr:hypothetical protein [Roseateles sp.]
MPFREKSAWLALIAILLSFGPYFAIVASGGIPMEGLPNMRMMGLYTVVCAVQVSILAIGHVCLRQASPVDARTPPDERDRALMYRCRTRAYYVLITGTVLVGCFMPFYTTGWRIVNATIFMISLAEVVYYGSLVASYRKQAA